MNEPMTPPKRFRRLIDRCMDADRRWFATHYGETEYTRPYIPGEIWPESGDYDVVLVREIAPGVRVRYPRLLKKQANARPELD